MIIGKTDVVISDFIQQSSAEEPHLAGGLSSHFKCELCQILDKMFRVEFKAQGVMAPGKAFHQWIQARLTSGMAIDGTFLIIGHEQFVFIHTENGDRRSPIDTLVWNLQSREYEVWDWKTTQIDLKYIRKLDEIYEAQANIYAQAFAIREGLKYNPVCRVIYVSKDDWCDLKEFAFVSRPELYVKSLNKIHVVDQNLGMFNKVGIDKVPVEAARALATGLLYWSDTKVPYRKTCRYCDHKEHCVTLIKAKVGPDEIDTAEVVI